MYQTPALFHHFNEFPCVEVPTMKVARFARQFRYSVGVLVLMGALPSAALAQDDHMHGAAPAQPMTSAQKSQVSALVTAVRQATARFQDVRAAEAEGYALAFGCVSGSDLGAMGMHFVNGPLVGDGEIDVNHPEIILYEPQPNGRLRLTGADYLVDAATWNLTHSNAPELMGQLFHLFDAPNRFGLAAFYTLHVWAWKDNPNGTFTNWNPAVSCDAFAGESMK
jgi:hypothetical protein